MPELPEVERVRLSLEETLVGRRVDAVDVRRLDIIEPSTGKKKVMSALLLGQHVAKVLRHGKQLAIVAQRDHHGNAGGCICIHLGMSGSLVASQRTAIAASHTHVIWRLDNGAQLAFRDPRRFGGIWTFRCEEALREARWNNLGVDALSIDATSLHAMLQTTRRSVKAALLDQQIVAGMGNIYVDELLFELRIHPLMSARRLKLEQVDALVTTMRALLARAIAGGGSSLRDYVDGNGKAGQFQLQHQVYGRGGEPCTSCASSLVSRVIAGRTTVFCAKCQRRSANRQVRREERFK